MAVFRGDETHLPKENDDEGGNSGMSVPRHSFGHCKIEIHRLYISMKISIPTSSYTVLMSRNEF